MTTTSDPHGHHDWSTWAPWLVLDRLCGRLDRPRCHPRRAAAPPARMARQSVHPMDTA